MPITGATCTSLGIFLRTLLTPGREELASHVRTLRFEFEIVTDEPREVYWSGSRSHLPISYPLLSHGRQLMQLLHLLPRLQVLHFSPPSYRPTFRHLLESAAHTETLPCGLQSLREVHCPSTDDCDGVSFRTLLVFLQLPQICRIEVTSINRFSYSESPVEGSVSSSTATHLRFSRAGLPDWLLSQVLLVPIALTHFWYSAIPTSGFQMSSFMATLGTLRPSLQYLHLDFGDTTLTSDELPLLYNDGSLREWPVLRTLSCSLLPLLGGGRWDGSPRLMNVLPPGLRELEILQDIYWSVAEKTDQIVEMLAEKRWAVPGLAKLAVVVESGLTYGALDDLVVACEAAGVSFVKDSFPW